MFKQFRQDVKEMWECYKDSWKSNLEFWEAYASKDFEKLESLRNKWKKEEPMETTYTEILMLICMVLVLPITVFFAFLKANGLL